MYFTKRNHNFDLTNRFPSVFRFQWDLKDCFIDIVSQWVRVTNSKILSKPIFITVNIFTSFIFSASNLPQNTNCLKNVFIWICNQYKIKPDIPKCLLSVKALKHNWIFEKKNTTKAITCCIWMIYMIYSD